MVFSKGQLPKSEIAQVCSSRSAQPLVCSSCSAQPLACSSCSAQPLACSSRGAQPLACSSRSARRPSRSSRPPEILTKPFESFRLEICAFGKLPIRKFTWKVAPLEITS